MSTAVSAYQEPSILPSSPFSCALTAGENSLHSRWDGFRPWMKSTAVLVHETDFHVRPVHFWCFSRESRGEPHSSDETEAKMSCVGAEKGSILGIFLACFYLFKFPLLWGNHVKIETAPPASQYLDPFGPSRSPPCNRLELFQASPIKPLPARYVQWNGREVSPKLLNKPTTNRAFLYSLGLRQPTARPGERATVYCPTSKRPLVTLRHFST
jgi:hypothetical protein